jgi:hypothetical protein
MRYAFNNSFISRRKFGETANPSTFTTLSAHLRLYLQSGSDTAVQLRDSVYQRFSA